MIDLVKTTPPSGNAQDYTTHAAAVALGRRGGLKGGPARARVLSSSRRTEIAKHAALVRWGKSYIEEKPDYMLERSSCKTVQAPQTDQLTRDGELLIL